MIQFLIIMLVIDNDNLMSQIMDNDAQPLAIIVFLRCPKPGQVKTRLAKRIGNENACLLYKLCAERVLRSILCDSKISVYVFYSVKEEERDVQDWLDASLVHSGRSLAGVFAQKQVDCLGDRIMHAIDVVSRLQSGLNDTIVGIVGTDVPDLSAGVVRQGAKAMEQGAGKMAVLGPSVDGGFYMMLLHVSKDNGCRLDMLDGIEWSTDTVCVRTEEALKNSGYSVVSHSESVPVLRDIDELRDLVEWNKSNKDDDEFCVAVKKVVTEYHSNT